MVSRAGREGGVQIELFLAAMRIEASVVGRPPLRTHISINQLSLVHVCKRETCSDRSSFESTAPICESGNRLPFGISCRLFSIISNIQFGSYRNFPRLIGIKCVQTCSERIDMFEIISEIFKNAF